MPTDVNLSLYEKQAPPRFVFISADATAAVDDSGKPWRRVEYADWDKMQFGEAWMRIECPALVEVK